MEYDDELKDMYFVVVRMLVLFVSLMDDKTTPKTKKERKMNKKNTAKEKRRESEREKENK